MIKISKELLSEVLGVEVYKILPDRKIIGAEKTLEYETVNSFRPYDYINICELAHKCKEWAFKSGGELSSFKANHSGIWMSTVRLIDIYARPISFSANTEVEAIFKACEWILKELKK